MTNQLPGTLRLPSRDTVVAKFLRDYRLKHGDAETTPGTQPYIDAQTAADVVAAIYYDAQVIANGTQDSTSEGVWLERRGEALGAPRGEATGGSGFVTISASSGGGFIDAGIELRHKATRLRYKCIVADTYDDGDEVPIEGIDTGPATNLAPGDVMEWTSPPVGIGSTATVFENSDGTGLTGGRDEQNDPEYRDAIAERRANPPASGNDAAYQAAIIAVRGLGIQQGFTYPCIKGPGSTGIAFTMRPASPGASRIPNAAQLALVEADLKAQFPGDDEIFVCALLDQFVYVVLRVTWKSTAAGWADITPWPPYLSPTVRVFNSPLPTPLVFTLYTSATTPPNPVVGQTIGFYNRTTGKFLHKRIGAVSTSVVGSDTRWAITCDTTNNASDTSFTPTVNDRVSPWSDSLNLVAPAVIAHFDETGPGEQVGTFYDAGIRQKRQPESPAAWPHELSERMMIPVFGVDAVARLSVAEPAFPYATTVGTPGVESYLFSLFNLAILSQ